MGIRIFFYLGIERYGRYFPRGVVAYHSHIRGETFAQHGFSSDDVEVGRKASQQAQAA